MVIENKLPVVVGMMINTAIGKISWFTEVDIPTINMPILLYMYMYCIYLVSVPVVVSGVYPLPLEALHQFLMVPNPH